ncbi:toll/interleukin-1 receptor domain-containing protein [Streptomyces sp. NBC_01210]|uniref:toll/interleukin-1 receptor domain-containing protein n=1 Tax=Streptomyces sp. NBC_01210 TaxID=2903774 RepID=UPI002E11DE5D|nr:toll/interleukin-1 receptor domain-containing protein [Streptomyces sp. NBC_01210]
MADPREAVAVTWNNAKQAALYFDHVLPCADYQEVPADLRFDFQRLMPTYRQLANEYIGPAGNEWDSFAQTIMGPSSGYEDETAWVADDYVVAAHAALSRLDIASVPMFSDIQPEYPRLLDPQYYIDGGDTPPDITSVNLAAVVEIKLIDMRVVDTANAPWEQIAEFRRDRRSVSQLRRMRLLFDEDLRGKSPAYIQDYVSIKLEDYDAARKAHGFETVSGAIDAFANSKTLLGVSAVVAAGVFGGHWAAAGGTAALGAVIETTRATVHVLKRKHEMITWKENAELGYIVEARRRTNPARTVALHEPEEPAGDVLGGKTWDIFISHASEDKTAVARPLRDALTRLGVTVWLDEAQMRIGHSLRRKIDEGIRASRYGVVVLSESFFAKGWTNHELDGLVTRNVAGEQSLLPIWHNLSADGVRRYSPSLADKVAMSTADYSIDEIAEQIADVVQSGAGTE